jgi:hypothetical protein
LRRGAPAVARAVEHVVRRRRRDGSASTGTTLRPDAPAQAGAVAPRTAIDGQAAGRIVPLPHRPPAGRVTPATSRIGWAVQRKFTANPNPPPAFLSDAVRPKWQAHANRSLLAGYNAQTGGNVTAVPYVANNLDRAHVLSFQDIESTILDFLNGDLSASAFTVWFYTFTSGVPDSPERRNVEKAVTDLATFPSAKTANTALGRLNSLSPNLRAASGTMNSYIGANPDLQGNYSPGGQWHATDASRTAHSLSQNPMLLTPEHHSRFVTSEGPVPLGSLSPHMQHQMQGQSWQTRGVHSASTMGAVYSGSTQTSIKGGASGTFNFAGVSPAPADLAGLWYEYGMLKKNMARDAQQEQRFQDLLAILQRVGWRV